MSDAYAADLVDDEAAEPTDLADEGAAEKTGQPPASLRKLYSFASHKGNLCDLLTETQLTTLGADVVEDYVRDDASRAEWKRKALKALDRAAQEKIEDKEYPWKDASNVSFPLLTVAALQFQARAYPAIIKNDEAVMVKVFGSVNPPAHLPPQVQQLWGERRQAKKRRAQRVSDYMNYVLFYKLDDWETDTDALLLQLPIVGCAFRKVWQDADTGECRACYVPALRLVVNQDVRNLKTAPRATEEIPEVYPYQITGRMRAGEYREVTLTPVGEDEQAPRLLLEQHRMHDLDGDGVEEPYVVTVDHESREVLRIEAAYTSDTVRMNGDKVVGFRDRFMPYEKYGFFPDPKGRFYDIGFGHLLDQVSDVINTAINELIDAGHAQIAGGGFIASGLRLQGNGQTNTLRWRPGEYKTVSASPGGLQQSIYERPFPAPSPVMFQLLDLMMGAAKDITATKDVITGEAPSNAPVGTTLALIEQGLQVFVAIYKRVFRSLKGEFRLLYSCVGAYGDAQDYSDVTDDPEADLKADFAADGNDILPVSDPATATKMQSMAKGQFLLGLVGKGLNDPAIYKRAMDAFGIDEPEELIPQGPNPGQEAQAGLIAAKTEETKAKAGKARVEAAHTAVETAGKMHAAERGRIPGLEGPADQPVGVPGDPGGSGGPEGGVAEPVMAGG
jgi:chaperonin GroES